MCSNPPEHFRRLLDLACARKRLCSSSATLTGVSEIPARELRNDVSSVLRRVETGERLTVTVSGRRVAELVPLAPRPRSIGWEAFIEGAEDWRSDAGLADELAELLPDTTDDISVQ